MVKNLPANAGAARDSGWDPWMRKSLWRRKWWPTPVFLTGKSHGQRILGGYSPRGHKESDTTEWLSTHTRSVTQEAYHRGNGHLRLQEVRQELRLEREVEINKVKSQEAVMGVRKKSFQTERIARANTLWFGGAQAWERPEWLELRKVEAGERRSRGQARQGFISQGKHLLSSNGKPLKCVKQDMSFLSAMCQAEDFFPKCQQSESTPDWL